MSIGSMLAADVLALLRTLGRIIILRRVTEGTYAPSTGLVSGGSTADSNIFAALISYRNREVDGQRIMAGDRKCVMSSLGLVTPPVVGDRVVADSVVYTLVSPMRLYEANGVPIAYVGQVRNV